MNFRPFLCAYQAVQWVASNAFGRELFICRFVAATKAGQGKVIDAGQRGLLDGRANQRPINDSRKSCRTLLFAPFNRSTRVPQLEGDGQYPSVMRVSTQIASILSIHGEKSFL